MKHFLLPLSILILALTIFLTSRTEYLLTGRGLYKVDKVTGSIEACTRLPNNELRCP